MSSDPRNSAGDSGGRRDAVRDRRAQLGRDGEELACQRLAALGLLVVARNWRCRLGEVDVIAAGPGLLVFCEVKARRGHGYGTPAEAVTLAKQARLRRLAAAYLDTVEHPPCRVRFDVVAVTWPHWPRGADPAVDHLEGAF